MPATDPLPELTVAPPAVWPAVLRTVRANMQLYETALSDWETWLAGSAGGYANGDRFILLQMVQFVIERGLARHKYLNQALHDRFVDEIHRHYLQMSGAASLFVDSLRDPAVIAAFEAQPLPMQAALAHWLVRRLHDTDIGLDYLMESAMRPVARSALPVGEVTRVQVPQHLRPGPHLLFAEPESPIGAVATLAIEIRGLADVRPALQRPLLARRLRLDLVNGGASLQFDPAEVALGNSVLAGTTLEVDNALAAPMTLVQPWAASWLPGPGPRSAMERGRPYTVMVPADAEPGSYDLWCLRMPVTESGLRLSIEVVAPTAAVARGPVEVDLDYPGAIAAVRGATLGSSGPQLRPGTAISFIRQQSLDADFRVCVPWRVCLPIAHPQRLLQIAAPHAATGLWLVAPQEATPPDVDEQLRDLAIDSAKDFAGALVGMMPALLRLETINLDDNAEAFFRRASALYGVPLPAAPQRKAEVRMFLAAISQQQRDLLANTTALNRLGAGLASLSVVIDIWKVQKSFFALLEEHTDAGGSLDVAALVTDIPNMIALLGDLQSLADDFFTTHELLVELGYVPARYTEGIRGVLGAVGTGIQVVEAGLALRAGLRELDDHDFAEGTGQVIQFGGAVIGLSGKAVATAVGFTRLVPYVGLISLAVTGVGIVIGTIWGRSHIESWLSHTYFGSDSKTPALLRSERSELTSQESVTNPAALFYKWITVSGDDDLHRMITEYLSVAFWNKDLDLRIRPSIGARRYLDEPNALSSHLYGSLHHYPLQVQLHKVPVHFHLDFRVSVKAAPTDTGDLREVWSGRLREMQDHESGTIRSKKLDQRLWHDTYWVEVDIHLPSSFFSRLVRAPATSPLGPTPATEVGRRDFPFVIRRRAKFPFYGRIDGSVFGAGIPAQYTHFGSFAEQELW